VAVIDMSEVRSGSEGLSRGPAGKRIPQARRERRTPVRPLHTAVPGRIRVSVDGLQASPRLKRIIEHGLASKSGIVSTEASTLTGNVLVLYDPQRPTRRIVDLIAALVDEAPQLSEPPDSGPAHMASRRSRGCRQTAR